MYGRSEARKKVEQNNIEKEAANKGNDEADEVNAQTHNNSVDKQLAPK